ncbi:Tfp pilus assembly protein PilF [Streptomyces sp. 3211.6]|uniref:tetratricopeptide repeat protein n=1 Tax=Streptomyces TaxID=1883 RepID=UPI0009A4D275|nr:MULTISPECIES: tetratricopeptide repeat protein [Streptomyces]RKT03303.1 Tfp pilus assembly protein PilF [Streptomyces sp. 3211.6]RPF29276.1 Tfp pilus assembly protein PilF [Streptomyces sp. Ag109_G2-6]
MKTRIALWTGLTAAVVVANVATGWVHLLTGDPKSTSSTASGPESPAAKRAARAEALLQAGIKQGEAKDFPGATHSFRQVLDLNVNPADKLAWYNLGVIAQHDNRTADARAAYDHALKIDPNFESALYNKALLVESNHPDEAIAILRHIVGADPKAATAHLHLGRALARKGRDKEAGEAFGLAVRADPSLLQFVPEEFRDSASAALTATQVGTTE